MLFGKNYISMKVEVTFSLQLTGTISSLLNGNRWKIYHMIELKKYSSVLSPAVLLLDK